MALDLTEIPRETLEQTKFLSDVEQLNFVVTLRIRGLTYREIAQALAERNPPVILTPDAVKHQVRRYLSRTSRQTAETVEELRVMENERLDELLRVWGPKARDGNEKAAQIVLRISERRAKMNGLDAAQKVEHTGGVSVLHELGVDPEEVKREREAFESAFGRTGLPDPAENIIELGEGDIEELPGGDEHD